MVANRLGQNWEVCPEFKISMSLPPRPISVNTVPTRAAAVGLGGLVLRRALGMFYKIDWPWKYPGLSQLLAGAVYFPAQRGIVVTPFGAAPSLGLCQLSAQFHG